MHRYYLFAELTIRRPAKDIFPPKWNPICLLINRRSDGDRHDFLRGPPGLQAVTPDAMHDHRQPAGECDNRPLPARRLATFIAQAFSQDHFVTRASKTCAAS